MSKKVVIKVKIFALLLLPIALFLIPLDAINEERTICLFTNIFGSPCYACGITRAIIAAVQFEFVRA
jgi:hypothetical protein